MSDLDFLPDHQQTLLKIKMDGHIEAAVQAAQSRKIGLQEALSLTIAAVAFKSWCLEVPDHASARMLQRAGIGCDLTRALLQATDYFLAADTAIIARHVEAPARSDNEATY